MPNGMDLGRGTGKERKTSIAMIANRDVYKVWRENGESGKWGRDNNRDRQDLGVEECMRHGLLYKLLECFVTSENNLPVFQWFHSLDERSIWARHQGTMAMDNSGCLRILTVRNTPCKFRGDGDLVKLGPSASHSNSRNNPVSDKLLSADIRLLSDVRLEGSNCFCYELRFWRIFMQAPLVFLNNEDNVFGIKDADVRSCIPLCSTNKKRDRVVWDNDILPCLITHHLQQLGGKINYC